MTRSFAANSASSSSSTVITVGDSSRSALGTTTLATVITCRLSSFSHELLRAMADAATDAQQIFSESGVTGGFVVQLGVGDGSLTLALKQNDSIQVHGLESDVGNVAAVRRRFHEAGVYGDVSVAHFTGSQLPV